MNYFFMTEQKKQWYDLWFDSPLYHILYKNRDKEEAEHFIDAVIKYLNITYIYSNDNKNNEMFL